jgi:phage-related protein
MAREVRIAIVGDARDLRRALDDSDTALSRFGDKVQNVGAKLTKIGAGMTVGITAPLAALGKLSFDAASDLNESLSKSQVVFGEFAAEIARFGDTAAKNLGLSKQQAIEAAATFGNLFRTMGLGAPETAAMSQNIVKLASDLASFNNIDPAEALEKLRSGLVGEAEPLRALGVQLTEATVKTKAMELGLADSNGELSESAKVQARYALILEQTQTAQGDFARTADGAANKQRILSAQFKDTAANIGNKLIPIGQKLLGWVQSLLAWFEKLSPEMQNVVLIAAAAAAALGPLTTVIGGVTFVIGGLVTVITALSLTAGIVIVGIVALAAAAVYAYQNFEGFRDVVDSVASFLVETAWPAIQTFISDLIDGFKEFYTVMRTVWDGIVTVVESAWNNGLAYVFDLIQLYIGSIITTVQTAADLWKIAWDAMGAALKWVWDNVIEPVVGFIQSAVDKAVDLIDKLKSAAEGVGGVFGAIGDYVGDALTLGRNAAGTNYWPGGLSWVGERGPELVDLPRGSKVRSNAESMQLAGGSSQPQIIQLVVDSKILAQVLYRHERALTGRPS